MQTTQLITTSLLALGVAAVAAGCASGKSNGAAKEVEVTMSALSAPARATVEKQTAGGQVDKITREIERGMAVYDVEATVNGKHMEYLVAESNGELLGTEVPVDFSELPEPVKTATEKYFGTTSGLTVMKGVEFGETQYEIEGLKNGRKVEVSFDPTGKRGD